MTISEMLEAFVRDESDIRVWLLSEAADQAPEAVRLALREKLDQLTFDVRRVRAYLEDEDVPF